MLSVKGIVRKTVKLRCKYSAGYRNQLWYGRFPVAVFEPGSYEAEVEFTYIDDIEAAIIGAIGGGICIALGASAWLKKR